ncbi:11020_t:CDS:2 [Rhizophagus irregularis]|uniref:Uncharacterized protein n=1 Tax=Rhizophagus irregularis (strain DAOM 181602 / DAOM 197198 / MUCL 43194) TaxID=747089 RepID=U9U5K5_RHIID|nr:11020_t:CDS:2 [Rhizophagus irregularis]
MTTLLVASFLTRLTQDEKWDLVNVTLEIPIKDFDNNLEGLHVSVYEISSQAKQNENIKITNIEKYQFYHLILVKNEAKNYTMPDTVKRYTTDELSLNSNVYDLK